MAAAIPMERQTAEVAVSAGQAHLSGVGPDSEVVVQPNPLPDSRLQAKVLTHLFRVRAQPAPKVRARVPGASGVAQAVNQVPRVVPPLEGVAHRRMRLTNATRTGFRRITPISTVHSPQTELGCPCR